MHKSQILQKHIDVVTKRNGKPHSITSFYPDRTALVVIDLQNYYMLEGQAACSSGSPDIVPNVNRLTAAVRAAGAKVMWARNIAKPEMFESWSVRYNAFTPERCQSRLNDLSGDGLGYQFWPELEIRPEDVQFDKMRYSALVPGASDLEKILAQHGIDTMIICGVATNVCVESTARDAMMMNYRVLMVSDCCATDSDDEHNGTLNNFYRHFGDVQTCDETIAMLEASAKAAAAE